MEAPGARGVMNSTVPVFSLGLIPLKKESGPPKPVVSTWLTPAQSLAGSPGSPLCGLGLAQMPSPSKPMMSMVEVTGTL